MKIYFFPVIICCLLFTGHHALLTKENLQSISIAADPQQSDLAEFSLLVPIKILNANSKDPYLKYGIDFSGNCYACDLAAISITKKHFDIINVCDENNFYRNEKFTYEASANSFTIKTEKRTFIFTKTDKAPVYELKITGEKLSLKNKVISKYYTQKATLNKFKVHNCGEFDG